MLTDYEHSPFVGLHRTLKSSSGNAFPGTIKERFQSCLNLPKRAPKARIWLMREGGCSVWFLLYRHQISPAQVEQLSGFFSLCSLSLLSCQSYKCTSTFPADYTAYHKLRANRNLTENRDLGNLCAACRTKNCRVTSSPSVCFYFHARKGDFCSPLDTKAELPCLQQSCSYSGAAQPFVILLKEALESICCCLSEQFSSSGRIKSSHFNPLQAGAGSSVSQISRLMKAQEPTCKDSLLLIQKRWRRAPKLH